MYAWDEIVYGRGSQDLSSIVARHLKEKASKHKKLFLYTDVCGDQNKNIKMFLTLLKLVNSKNITIQSINQKFMVSGRTFLPNAAEFDLIEAPSSRKECPCILEY